MPSASFSLITRLLAGTISCLEQHRAPGTRHPLPSRGDTWGREEGRPRLWAPEAPPGPRNANDVQWGWERELITSLGNVSAFWKSIIVISIKALWWWPLVRFVWSYFPLLWIWTISIYLSKTKHLLPLFFLNWSIVDLLVAQSCPTLCNPMDCGPSGSSVHGILQARILEGVSILFSRGSSRPRDWTQVSCFAGNFFTVWATREGVKRWGSPLELSFLFYWNIIGLQCCVNLCSIAKWFSYTYIYIYTYTFF